MNKTDSDPLAPISMVRALGLLLLCQLGGEFIVSAFRIGAGGPSFPGPVVGMALLFLILGISGRMESGPKLAGLETTGRAILGNLSLLFVPAAVGIVQYGDVLAESGVALIVALVVSTLATLVVTVLTFSFVARAIGAEDDDAA